MSRFTFTQKLGDTPSSSEYNIVKDDFLTYINTTKLDQDNLEDEAIRFRHLRRAPVIALFKDCGNAIWASDDRINMLGRTLSAGATTGDWDLFRDKFDEADNTCQLEYNAAVDVADTVVLEFTFWYYPYSIYAASEVAPAVRIKATGSWIALTEHRRAAGVGIGFYTVTEQVPYDPDPSWRNHPFTQFETPPSFSVGEIDRPGTVAYGGPIICTVGFDKDGASGYRLDQIDAFGMMVSHNTSRDTALILEEASVAISQCSKYDRLFLTLIARDN